MGRKESSVNSINLSPILISLLFPCILIVWVGIHGNEKTFLYINQNFHTPFLDILMPYITRIGEGIVFIPMMMMVMIYSKSRFLKILLSVLISFLFIQFLKTYIFFEEVRPAFTFKETISNIHTIPGIELHYFHSFPSGHSTSAFACLISLACQYKQIPLQIFIILFAILTAWSRVYLAQHFPLDIAIGALIGILTAWGIEKLGKTTQYQAIEKKIFQTIKK